MTTYAWRSVAVGLGAVAVLGLASCGGGITPEEREAAECRRVANEAHQAVDDGAVLLDVRTVAEYTQEHLTDAVNIPVEDLEERMQDELERDVAVVVYCETGTRSERAAEILRRAGFQVVVLGKMSNYFC